MGESTCLRRSFSNPSSTAFPEFKEGDPIRALTESVSFGRFVSDSLHWEKWSAFSSKRYLEEAERFLKPGSVAQKKAFFEAHYRRKAARHATSQVKEVVAPVPRDSLEDGEEDSEEQEVPIMLSDKIPEVDNRSSIENRGTDSSSVEIDCHANVTDESRDVVELAEPAEGKEDDLLPHLACLCEDLHVSETEETPNKSADSRSEISPDNQGTVDWHFSDSHAGKELKLTTTTSTPDKTLNPTLPKAPASSKPKTADNAAGNGRKSSLKRIEEMRIPPRPRLLHMSINLASAGGLSKACKTRDSTFPPTSKEMLYSTSIGNKPKVPVCTAPKQSLGARSSDVKSASILSKSTTPLMRMKTDKKPNPVHSSYSKCTTITETRLRPATVCAAFSLRSAERAEKRKEFFLKQQERIVAKEAERHQLVHRCQVCSTKPSGDSRPCCSSGSVSVRLIVANNLKPSLVRPQQRSPKSRNNLGNNKGPDAARSRPFWHISVAAKITNQASSKGSRRTTYSSSSHLRKHVQESASPNIPVKKCHWPCFDSRNVPSS